MYNYNYYYTSWLAHYGMKHKSGRYSYGTGDRPYRHDPVRKARRFLGISAALLGVSVAAAVIALGGPSAIASSGGFFTSSIGRKAMKDILKFVGAGALGVAAVKVMQMPRRE